MLRVAVLLLFALVLAVGTASCGGGEDETTAPETVENGGTETGATETETETEDGAAQGDPANGKEIFAAQGCGGCHVLSDAGTSGNVGPDLDESKPDYELVVDRVTNGAGAMPSFKDQLSEQEIMDVAAYVSTAVGS